MDHSFAFSNPYAGGYMDSAKYAQGYKSKSRSRSHSSRSSSSSSSSDSGSEYEYESTSSRTVSHVSSSHHSQHVNRLAELQSIESQQEPQVPHAERQESLPFTRNTHAVATEPVQVQNAMATSPVSGSAEDESFAPAIWLLGLGIAILGALMLGTRDMIGNVPESLVMSHTVKYALDKSSHETHNYGLESEDDDAI